MKYKLHMAWANNEALTREAVESARDIGNIHLWPNNGAPLLGLPDVTEHLLPVMSPISVINMMIQSSWDDDVMFWMHNDGLAKPGIAADFLSFVKGMKEQNLSDDWGVCFTLYDILCAFNMKAVREIGYWDPMFFQYTADNDYYHRLKHAGYREVQYPKGRDGVEHRGSMTVRTDQLFNYITQWRERTRFDKKYYQMKWGGECTNESFDKPFEDFTPKPGPLAW